jgi:hypothetical protein
MKNRIKVIGDKTIIYLDRRDGTVIEVTIDTEDLDLLREIPVKWHAYWHPDTKSFYCRATLNRKSLRLHRVIMNCPKDKQVDHINHDTLNNTKGNLRVVTNAENLQNRSGATRNSKSGIRGVYWDKQRGKWRASIFLKGKTIYLGVFDDIKLAEKAAINARVEMMPYYVAR